MSNITTESSKVDRMDSLNESIRILRHELANFMCLASGRLQLIKILSANRDCKLIEIEKQCDSALLALKNMDLILSNTGWLFFNLPSSKIESVNINEAIMEASRLCSLEFKSNNIHYSLESNIHKACLFADYNIMTQLFVNLFLNSIYALNGACEKWIYIKLYTEENFIKVEVTDSGPGISKEVQERLFTRYISTKASDKSRGLGLYICKKIVEMYSGQIFYNHKSQNTCFIIVLPLCH